MLVIWRNRREFDEDRRVFSRMQCVGGRVTISAPGIAEKGQLSRRIQASGTRIAMRTTAAGTTTASFSPMARGQRAITQPGKLTGGNNDNRNNDERFPHLP